MCRNIAFAAERASDASGATREFAELQACILRQEKEHRAFGRRLVGADAVKGRFTLAQAVDYFIARTLADAMGANWYGWERQITALVGLRDDYVRAAILMARAEFREKFWTELSRVFPKPIPSLSDANHARLVLKQAASLDYCALVGGSNV